MKPLLIDMDGVLRIGKTPAKWLREFIEFINKSKVSACIISNSTLSSSKQLKEFFDENSIDVPFPIMTSADATLNYAKENYESVSVYCSEPVRSMFNELQTVDQPEAVIIGDMGKTWDFKTLNEIFVQVLNGADIIAMQKNRYWKTPEEGYLLDVGPFVKAIEYAVSKESILIGKPSKLYFQMALRILNLPIDSKFIMLGDDLETDIRGSQELGSEGILIYTGKTSRPMLKDSQIKPDYETNDLLEVIDLVKTLN